MTLGNVVPLDLGTYKPHGSSTCTEARGAPREHGARLLSHGLSRGLQPGASMLVSRVFVERAVTYSVQAASGTESVPRASPITVIISILSLGLAGQETALELPARRVGTGPGPPAAPEGHHAAAGAACRRARG